MKLTFGTTKKFEVPSLSGYRMAACIEKDKGFGNNFFVFAIEQRPSPQPFEASPLPTASQSVLDELTISDEPTTHIHFDEIMLDGVQTLITHRERLRIFRFRIQGAGAKAAQLAAQFTHGREADLNSGDLGDKYTFSVGNGRLEPLLAFTSSQTRELVGMRFVSLLGKTNSFFEYFLEQNNQVFAKGASPNIEIGFPLANSLQITSKNLDSILLEENWGAFCNMPSPDLRQVLRAASRKQFEAVLEAQLPALDNSDFREHSIRRTFESRGSAEFLQTATIILANPGADPYRTLPII